MSYYSSKQSATNAAVRMAKRLAEKVGGKWTVRVHENLGWHACVLLGAVSVRVTPYGDGPAYYVMVGDDRRYPGTGCPSWSVDGSFKTPEEAARAGMAKAYEGVNELLKWMFDDTLGQIKKKGAAVTAKVLQIETNEYITELKKKQDGQRQTKSGQRA